MKGVTYLIVRYIGRIANNGKVWIFTITPTNITYRKHFTNPKEIKSRQRRYDAS